MPPRRNFDPCRITSFQHVLLYLLDDNEFLGVELFDLANAELNEAVRQPRFYQNLSKLVEKGLVSKQPRDGRGNSYRLSEEGRNWLRQRREWEHQLTKHSW